MMKTITALLLAAGCVSLMAQTTPAKKVPPQPEPVTTKARTEQHPTGSAGTPEVTAHSKPAATSHKTSPHPVTQAVTHRTQTTTVHRTAPTPVQPHRANAERGGVSVSNASRAEGSTRAAAEGTTTQTAADTTGPGMTTAAAPPQTMTAAERPALVSDTALTDTDSPLVRAAKLTVRARLAAGKTLTPIDNNSLHLYSRPLSEMSAVAPLPTFPQEPTPAPVAQQSQPQQQQQPQPQQQQQPQPPKPMSTYPPH